MIIFEFLSCIVLIFCVGSTVLVVLKHDRAARMLAKQLRFNHRVPFKTHEKGTVKIMGIVVGLFLIKNKTFLRP